MSKLEIYHRLKELNTIFEKIDVESKKFKIEQILHDLEQDWEFQREILDFDPELFEKTYKVSKYKYIK